MKKPMKIALLSALVVACAAGACKLATEASLAADAAQSASLFLPGSYEQYLELAAPADVAIGEHYFAIADGKNIYVYDRTAEEGEYRVYTHLPDSSMPITISKLQFTDEDRLYFADSAQELYELHLDTLTPSDRLLSLSTFYIEGRTLYAVTVALSTGTTIYKLSLDRPLSIATADYSQQLSRTPATPSMSYGNGILYCAVDNMAYPYRGDTLDVEQPFRLDKNLDALPETSAICAVGEDLFYTDNRGLSVTDTTGNSSRLFEGDGFGALSFYGGYMYCVKDTSVRELAVTDGSASYTGYEIASGSDSVNRLSNATDTVRSGDLIVTADSGNRRVSVYDRAEDTFSLLDCDGIPTCVATDGKIIAVGAGKTVSLYRRGANEPYYVHQTESTLTGVACVYEKCYFVTEHSYGIAEEGEREFTRSHSPVALTCDVYGNLYVADQQNTIVKYTEKEFLDYESAGVVVTGGWQLPSGFRSLRADFEGNLYYLYQNTIYREGTALTTVNADGLVRHNAPLSPVSFALAFEDGGLYVQYGNLMCYTEADFPTLSTISAEGMHGEIFSSPDKEGLSYVNVRADAAGIRMDLSKLAADSPYFTYSDHARTANGGPGVLIATLDRLSLVALYEDYGYTVALFRTEDCTEITPLWTNAANETRYLSSEAALSYYPCYSNSLTIARLPRGTVFRLLATVTTTGRDYDYAYVETETGTRGYLPLSYLVELSPIVPPADVYTLGYLKESEEGVTFRSVPGGEKLVVHDRTRVMIYKPTDGSGLYLVQFFRDGTRYTAQVNGNLLETGNQNALRNGIIIILCVLAVGIVASYVLLVPHKKKERAKK